MHRTVMLLMFLITTDLVGKEPPNVLLIYSDDQGTIDLNCYGAADLATPNLDKLAKSGVRFTRMTGCTYFKTARSAPKLI